MASDISHLVQVDQGSLFCSTVNGETIKNSFTLHNTFRHVSIHLVYASLGQPLQNSWTRRMWWKTKPLSEHFCSSNNHLLPQGHFEDFSLFDLWVSTWNILKKFILFHRESFCILGVVNMVTARLAFLLSFQPKKYWLLVLKLPDGDFKAFKIQGQDIQILRHSDAIFKQTNQTFWTLQKFKAPREL